MLDEFVALTAYNHWYPVGLLRGSRRQRPPQPRAPRRGRAWKKNDGCFVEQKNYSVVRRAVRYACYQGPAALRPLNELYAELRLHTNFLQPVMKLLRKERHGAKVNKTYDEPTTPCRRLLSASALDADAKRRLQSQYWQMNNRPFPSGPATDAWRTGGCCARRKARHKIGEWGASNRNAGTKT